MCPACIESAVMVVGGAMSTGGLAALATRVLRLRKIAEKILFWKLNAKEKE
jgi:hypothetical protein